MNKPVAWTNEKNLNNIQIGGAGYIWKLLAEKTDIPLYTHPVKELTDEEILEVWRENERVYPMDRSRLLDRTRACIKKASEK